MKRIAFSGALMLASFFSVNAQTADEVINKYIDAIGGKEKLGQVESVVIDGSMTVMGGANPYHTTIINGKGFKNEVEFNGTKIVQCVTDKGGWSINPMMGAAEPAPMSDEEYAGQKDNIYAAGPLFDYAAKGSKVELLPNEKLGDVDAQKIKLTNAAGIEYNFWFDVKTGYMIKMTIAAATGETAITFSDYRKTDFGILHPYATEITMPQGFVLTSAIDKININTKVDPEVFTMGK